MQNGQRRDSESRHHPHHESHERLQLLFPAALETTWCASLPVALVAGLIKSWASERSSAAAARAVTACAASAGWARNPLDVLSPADLGEDAQDEFRPNRLDEVIVEPRFVGSRAILVLPVSAHCDENDSPLQLRA